MIISWSEFITRLLLAFVLGAIIGVERQWRKTRAVLKTNVLVCLGASMFVMVSAMVPSDTSPTRVTSQIVSGVGFLGGGVILHEGSSVRGLNTAATLWCAAAIGSFIGFGYFFPAYAGALMVVGTNFALRPLGQALQQFDSKFAPDEFEIGYRLHGICKARDEERLRSQLRDLALEKGFTISAVTSESLDDGTDDLQQERVKIIVDLSSESVRNSSLDEMAIALKSSLKMSSIGWEVITNDPE
jgi:putative Mg2+ transporter-C (MgtC) family protein